MYYLVNFVFHFIHLFIVLLTVFGWLFHLTRDFYLLTQIFVLISWGLLGYFYKDYGICILTEWHRSWKMRYGHNFPKTYLQYLFQKLKVNIPEKYLGLVIFGYYFTTLIIGLVLYFVSRLR